MTDIEPIREGVLQIVELVARKHGVKAAISTPDEAMSAGYLALARANRPRGGEIYVAVKQIPAFLALVSNLRNSAVFAAVRPHSIPGMAAGGYGIRIDSPVEETYRAPQHQEFPGQLRSLDGLLFWSPLLPLTPDRGPV